MEIGAQPHTVSDGSQWRDVRVTLGLRGDMRDAQMERGPPQEQVGRAGCYQTPLRQASSRQDTQAGQDFHEERRKLG